MKKLLQLVAPVAIAIGTGDLNLARGQTNLPPTVSIVWPVDDDYCQNGYVFGPDTAIKIKAIASDPDGLIAHVKFFADANLIGVVSNAPFSLVWTGERGSVPKLKAVAVDNLGASTESVSVLVLVLGGFPTSPVFAVSAPPNDSVFAAPASFQFSAELLATYLGRTGPVEFFLGSNSVGTVTQSGPFTATMPLYSLTVTNVGEGDYFLRVKKDGYFANLSPCDPPRIRITRLGLQSPQLRPDSHFAFEVVTSFPTNQNVIEASSNLLNWIPISTNAPFTNTFTFTDPSPATNSPRFYRAVVPSQ